MRFLLDTNSCIIYLRGRNSVLKQRLESSVHESAVCSVVKGELFYGAMKSAKPEQSLRLQEAFLAQFVSLPFDDLAATLFGQIRSQLAVRGTPIGAYDLQIAAIALAHNLTLVTHNTREFSRVEGLQREDWEFCKIFPPLNYRLISVSTCRGEALGRSPLILTAHSNPMLRPEPRSTHPNSV